ncbi:CAF17-like 4Fe-4S cluster assembly/insertion protein YgfZ [Halomonas salipaludis]|uniref:Aminomethyltransferase n=1 Tax=Halomonas salipaludis TaxID=2032625 RepID=A0A2A2F3L5_9GAMM|nr:folate-binding protein YgfZ [Halomonas salipaludis]PAU79257.1 aminomethyltransferase [Halomonas salipaludis]
MLDWSRHQGAAPCGPQRVTFAPDVANALPPEQTAIAPLVHLGVLEIHGQGAVRFLQGQTSAQAELADGRGAPLTCFCTAKGRMLANAQLLRIDAERLWLIMPVERIAPLQAHLGKFAPFYQVTLSARDDLALVGVMGSDAAALCETESGLTVPHPWQQAGDATVLLLNHPGPVPRRLLIASQEVMTAHWQRLAAKATPVGNAQWCLLDIQAGLAWVGDAHQDAYLPQMFNWEALGGISFKKGCYTGQEVVARAHFRGQVKKRLSRLQCEGDALPTPGDGVEDANGKRQGDVIAAEFDAHGRIELLAVLSTRELAEPLAVAGRHCTRQELPYALERLDPEALFAAS